MSNDAQYYFRQCERCNRIVSSDVYQCSDCGQPTYPVLPEPLDNPDPDVLKKIQEAGDDHAKKM